MAEKTRPKSDIFFKRLSITPKMLLLTLLVGAGIWAVSDHIQGERLRAIFYAQQAERLGKEAQGARIHFDNYITAYNKAAKLFVSLSQFAAYLEEMNWFADNDLPVKYYTETPPWLPDASVLRKFARVHYALLLDGRNRAREIYQGLPEPVPTFLTAPDNLLRLLSHDQSYMTSIEGVPFVLTAESVTDPATDRKVTLMFASPLDDDFLASSLGFSNSQQLVVLVTGNSRVVASSMPELLPAGADINAMKDRYIVIGKSFFDDGASDLMLQFTSLISREEYENLSRVILSVERRQYAVSASAFILSFTILMLWMARHIKGLTREIISFSQDTLGAEPKEISKGDEIYLLKERFQHLTQEVIFSRNNLIREKTLLKEAHADLKAAQSQILQREKMASVGQLAAGVAHEINNPMGFIISNLGTLDKYAGKLTRFITTQSEALAGLVAVMPVSPEPAAGTDLDNEGSQKSPPSRKVESVIDLVNDERRALKVDYIVEDLKDLIRESLEGAERVKKIVQNLKGFARLDEVGHKSADINAGLDSTINIVWNELRYKATLKKEYGKIPIIQGNLGELNQVFMNLLVNAAQAIDTAGEIVVRTWGDEHAVFVSVSDTGCGIPAENINRIFEPFFTTKDVGKGTGLGLSIVYDIIRKHKGEIAVDSQVGKGTTFTLKLPTHHYPLGTIYPP